MQHAAGVYTHAFGTLEDMVVSGQHEVNDSSLNDITEVYTPHPFGTPEEVVPEDSVEWKIEGNISNVYPPLVWHT